MITPQTKLKEAILQCLEEINDALYTARQQGMVVLLPEEVDIQVSMVTGNDINVVQRTTSESETDGAITTTRRQTSPDTETQSRNGENFRTERTAGAQGTENTTRSQTSPDTETQTRSGENFKTERTAGAQGSETTTRSQTSPDNETQTRSGESFSTERQAGTQGSEEHSTVHPGVITSTGGGDSSKETVINTYAG